MFQYLSDRFLDVIMMSKNICSEQMSTKYFILLPDQLQAGAAESAEGFKNAYENQRADAGFLFKLLLDLNLDPKEFASRRFIPKTSFFDIFALRISRGSLVICVLKMVVVMFFLQDFPVCCKAGRVISGCRCRRSGHLSLQPGNLVWICLVLLGKGLFPSWLWNLFCNLK